MHLTTRNVNSAFRELVTVFNEGRATARCGECTDPQLSVVRRPSRNGSVLLVDEPVTVTYTHPRERILFNAARDANPFALLYEALWMLAGRNDVAPLAYYCKQFREYSDDGRTLNGAYGYRWRKADAPHDGNGLLRGATDQLDLLVSHLKADPTSRRAVLQMWNVEDDLLKIGTGKFVTCPDCHGNIADAVVNAVFKGKVCSTCKAAGEVPDGSKDVCCNLSVMFSLREGDSPPSGSPLRETYADEQGVVKCRYLDMTVTNRSNDLVWGLLGANYVTFTVLQEYLAARLGAEVGRYHHFSNNLHCYDDPGNKGVAPWRPAEWLKECEINTNRLCRGEVYLPTVPLVKDSEAFELEVKEFVERAHRFNLFEDEMDVVWSEPFLEGVADPMVRAYRAHKNKGATALQHCNQIKATDWRVACRSWLERRLNRA